MIREVVEPNGDTSVFIYVPKFLSSHDTEKCYEWLDCKEMYPVYTYGEKIIRYQLWFQKQFKYFNYKWPKYDRWYSCNYKEEPFINHLESKINEFINIQHPNCSVEINSCLINKYSDKSHRIHYHRDCPDVFGRLPVINVISVGADRTLNFKRVDNHTAGDFAITLESGSIFIMSGHSQVYYYHGIENEEEYVDNIPRYSLIFRHHIANETHQANHT